MDTTGKKMGITAVNSFMYLERVKTRNEGRNTDEDNDRNQSFSYFFFMEYLKEYHIY